MPTFREASPLSEPRGDTPVDLFTLKYMAGLARDRMHQSVLSAFIESGLSRAELARRLGWDKSRVSKVINTSSNLTIETLAEVLFAIDGSAPTGARDWPLRALKTNLSQPEWLGAGSDAVRGRTTIGASARTETTATPTIRQVARVPEHV